MGGQDTRLCRGSNTPSELQEDNVTVANVPLAGRHSSGQMIGFYQCV